MALKIDDDCMSLDTAGTVIATAARVGDRWTMSTWPDTLDRNQAIAALVLAERLAAGYGDRLHHTNRYATALTCSFLLPLAREHRSAAPGAAENLRKNLAIVDGLAS